MIQVKLIHTMEHRFVPGLTKEQRNALKGFKVVEVNQEAADFLLEYRYVEVVKTKPKEVQVKRHFDNTEAL